MNFKDITCCEGKLSISQLVITGKVTACPQIFEYILSPQSGAIVQYPLIWELLNQCELTQIGKFISKFIDYLINKKDIKTFISLMTDLSQNSLKIFRQYKKLTAAKYKWFYKNFTQGFMRENLENCHNSELLIMELIYSRKLINSAVFKLYIDPKFKINQINNLDENNLRYLLPKYGFSDDKSMSSVEILLGLFCITPDIEETAYHYLHSINQFNSSWVTRTIH